MGSVLDTATGTAVAAFCLERPAGDTDTNGNPVGSLAKTIIDAANGGGLININGSILRPEDLFPTQMAKRADISNWQDGILSVLVINGTFSPVTLAEDALIFYGGATPQILYPSYQGKTHEIPAARPHPTKPATFLCGVGVFSFDTNLWDNCCGALKFNTGVQGVGNELGLAFYSHLSSGSTAAVSVTADMSKFGGNAQSFYDATVGASTPALTGRDASGGIAICASTDYVDIKLNYNPMQDTYTHVKYCSVIARIYTPIPNYTVVADDTLIQIARQFYRSDSVYPNIVRANSGIITNPNVIGNGMVLTMPDLV